MATSSQSGQIAVIVLIISTIVLSLGLTLSKKTTIETKIDTDEELLKKAFNAAESGIDYFLGTGQKNYSSSDNNSSSAVSTSLLENTSTIDFEELTPVNTTQVYWLVAHHDDGTLDESVKYTSANLQICPTFSGSAGSLKVDYFYKNSSPESYHVVRTGYNFNSSPTAVTDFVSAVGSNCVTFSTPGDVPFILAVTPLFSSASIVLRGGSDFPSQGLEISASGKTGNPQSQVIKNIKVEKRYRLPDFFLEPISASSQIRTTP